MIIVSNGAPLLAALIFIPQLAAANCIGCVAAKPAAAQLGAKSGAASSTILTPLKQRPPAQPAAPVNDLKLAGAAKADLRPLPFYPDPSTAGLPQGFPGVLYCDPNPAGGTPNKVRFRLRNQGSAQAPATTVRITFVNGGIVDLPAPALAPGMETSGAANIPSGCYPPGFSTACQFSIRVDSLDQVSESVETNNATNSTCVQPAG